MKRHPLLHRLPLFVALAALTAAGCSNDPAGPGGNNTPDTTAVMASVDLQAFAGTAPLAFNEIITSESGSQYKVSMLRFYVSQFSLIDSAGNTVPATLVDSAGAPLKYDVAFCDFAFPETRTVRFLARKGSYKGFAFSIGVPNTSKSGAMLNHADASQFTYPLDVDTDMYWGWNPGYIFFKIEGSVMLNGTWTNMIYHIGGDNRLMNARVESPLALKRAGDNWTLMLNTNRLFVTPSGGKAPNMEGTVAERVVHGGAAADSMAVNAAKSGFITLKP
jgi:hypothetical protein